MTRRGGLPGLVHEAARRLRTSPTLRHSLLSWSAFGLLCTASLSVGVTVLHGPTVTTVAAVIAASLVWWTFITAALFCGAAWLNTPEGVVIWRYGIPNGLTALRSYLCLPLILMATLALPGRTGLVMWCSIGFAAGMLDAVDGIIARRFGPLTELGRASDPASDSLFFSMAAIGNVSLGIIPVWLAIVMLTRYFGPLLLTPLVLITGRRPRFEHTRWGRWNTILTGAVLFFCMWTRIFDGPVDIVALILGLPLLVPTTVLHFAALIERVRAASEPAVPSAT